MALRVDGRAMQFMSACMATDQELLLLAIRSYPKAFRFAAPALQQDQDFVMQAVLKNPEVLQGILVEKPFVESLLQACPAALEHLPYEAQADRSLVLLAIQSEVRGCELAEDAVRCRGGQCA